MERFYTYSLEDERIFLDSESIGDAIDEVEGMDHCEVGQIADIYDANTVGDEIVVGSIDVLG